MVGHNSFAFKQPAEGAFWLEFGNFRSSFYFMIEFIELMSNCKLKTIRGTKKD